MVLCFPEGGERVGRFARLGDRDSQYPTVHHGLAIAELRSHVDFDGQPRKRLDEVLPDQGGMLGCAGRYEAESIETCEVAISQPELRDPDVRPLWVYPFA